MSSGREPGESKPPEGARDEESEAVTLERRDPAESKRWWETHLASTVQMSGADAEPVSVRAAPLEEEGFAARYHVKAVLGEGGMGEVRLYGDRRIGREVAMKIMRPGRGSRSSARARFAREARVQGQLEHPAIVPVYDLGVGPEGAYFTMKRVRGRTLEQIIAGLRAGDRDMVDRYGMRRLLVAFNQVALAVAFAHSRGVLHRDLKPANIMLGDFGEVYVLDWGVAKIHGDSDLELAGGSSLEETSAGTIFGSAGYMSPEQAHGGAVDARSDVYSLGAVLFETLTLERLHPPGAPYSVIVSTVQGVEARPSIRAPQRGLPPEFDAICARATATSAEDRYPSARELVADIERFLDGERDMSLRRQHAAAHLAAGKAAAARAERPGAGPHARVEALRELNRALAFDPDQVEAAGTMAQLLLRAPAEDPAAVEALHEHTQTERRQVARFGAVAFLSWALLAPLLLVSGIRSWTAWLLTLALTLASSAICLWMATRSRPVSDLSGSVLMISSTIAIGVFSAYVGPFMLVPAMTAQNTVVFAMLLPKSPRRAVLVAFGTLAVVVPLLLEWTGVIPPSYAFRDGALVLLPRMTELPATVTTALLTIGAVALVIVPSFVITRFTDEGTAAKRRLFTQLWHLRQLVPDRPRAR